MTGNGLFLEKLFYFSESTFQGIYAAPMFCGILATGVGRRELAVNMTVAKDISLLALMDGSLLP